MSKPMKLLFQLTTWLLAGLLAALLLVQPIRLVQSLYAGEAFDALARGLRSGSPSFVELADEPNGKPLLSQVHAAPPAGPLGPAAARPGPGR